MIGRVASAVFWLFVGFLAGLVTEGWSLSEHGLEWRLVNVTVGSTTDGEGA